MCEKLHGARRISREIVERRRAPVTGGFTRSALIIDQARDAVRGEFIRCKPDEGDKPVSVLCSRAMYEYDAGMWSQGGRCDNGTRELNAAAGKGNRLFTNGRTPPRIHATPAANKGEPCGPIGAVTLERNFPVTGVTQVQCWSTDERVFLQMIQRAYIARAIV